LLESIGLEAERLRMVNVSSAMGVQFAALAEEMTAQIEHLGPSPLRDGHNGQGAHATQEIAGKKPAGRSEEEKKAGD
jgi:hypothetical protein